jgi:hypothetical protein
MCKTCGTREATRTKDSCPTCWNRKQYGDCQNGCRLPASSLSGLCTSCKKRGGLPPKRRNAINSTARRSCTICKKFFPVEAFIQHSHRCLDCHREYKRWNRIKNHYGLTKEQYLALGNKCFICGSTEKLNVDHDHSCCSGPKTCGKCVRGLLCMNCNLTIGKYNDNPEVFIKMSRYLNDLEVSV